MSTIPDEWFMAVANWAQRQPEIACVYFFGGMAKGNSSSRDLDIAILLRAKERSSADLIWMDNAAQWRQELSTLIPYPVDLELAWPETDVRVWPAVQEHGLIVYKKGDAV